MLSWKRLAKIRAHLPLCSRNKRVGKITPNGKFLWPRNEFTSFALSPACSNISLVLPEFTIHIWLFHCPRSLERSVWKLSEITCPPNPMNSLTAYASNSEKIMVESSITRNSIKRAQIMQLCKMWATESVVNIYIVRIEQFFLRVKCGRLQNSVAFSYEYFNIK